MSNEFDVTREITEDKYNACLKDFQEGILTYNVDNILCIVLYGGLVRDGKPIVGWSDIDLIVVFRDILARNVSTLSNLLNQSKMKYSIRIDLTQLDEKWLIDSRLLANCYNSEVINALAMRPDVSRILYGTLPSVSFTPDQEKLAARFYISHTLVAFRRYMLEDVMCSCTEIDLKHSVARVTRWMFSIIRASLRLFNIYVHPYGPSLDKVSALFPQIDLSIPYLLLNMRMKPASIRPDHSLFITVEAFLEKYVSFILIEAAKDETT